MRKRILIITVLGLSLGITALGFGASLISCGAVCPTHQSRCIGSLPNHTPPHWCSQGGGLGHQF